MTGAKKVKNKKGTKKNGQMCTSNHATCLCVSERERQCVGFVCVCACVHSVAIPTFHT